MASRQEALRHDPDHPMIYRGLALAAEPNPNSRSGGLPDDPQGVAREAIRNALDHIDRATPEEHAFIEALAVASTWRDIPISRSATRPIRGQPGTSSTPIRTTPTRGRSWRTPT